MDSILIYQAANDLVQNTGTRNIKRIARSCSLDILETPRFKDVLGFLSLHFDKPLILINSHLDSQTKQMVCGYALGHYLEHQCFYIFLYHPLFVFPTNTFSYCLQILSHVYSSATRCLAF